MPTKQVFTIDRSKWISGSGGMNSCLYRPTDQKQCCLGFFGEQLCGLTIPQMELVSYPLYPSVVNGFASDIGSWLISNGRISEDCDMLIEYNDNTLLDPQVREDRIKEIFAKHDIEVIFTGEYANVNDEA